MSYSNPFLIDFAPVFLSILQEKNIRQKNLQLFVIDEAPGEGIFEPVDVCSVLKQIAGELNFLQIYTDRPAYFTEFTETLYEENGLLTVIEPKRALKKWKKSCGFEEKRTILKDRKFAGVILDFEWEGNCYEFGMKENTQYIPIHKRPWEIAENLDIAVPIGYNTVIVKRLRDLNSNPLKDRFEMAFYGIGT